MRDRWIPDSSQFHKPIDEDSANEDALFVCGIFFMGIKKWGVIYGRNQEEIHGRSAHGSAPDQGSGGMKKSEEDRLKCVVYESTLSTADAVPLPQWGRLRNEDAAFLALSERIQDMWRKTISTNKAFPAWGRLRAERAG